MRFHTYKIIQIIYITTLTKFMKIVRPKTNFGCGMKIFISIYRLLI